jgi:hypothetical protein
MFLNKLDNDSKEVFLYLAHHTAKSDGLHSDMQQNLINGYLKEMNIQDVVYQEDKFSLVDCLKKVTNKEYQKVILIELLAIVYTDNIMDLPEKIIIDTIVDTWGINSSLVVVYGEWSRNLLSLYIQGEALLDLN